MFLPDALTSSPNASLVFSTDASVFLTYALVFSTDALVFPTCISVFD